jgi:predicted phosphodiesterase
MLYRPGAALKRGRRISMQSSWHVRWTGIRVAALLLALPFVGAAAAGEKAEQDWRTKPFDPRPQMESLRKRVAEGKERFRFVVMGDSQGTKAAPAGTKVREITALTERLAPDFVIHTGDRLTRGAESDGDWDKLAEHWGAFYRKFPFWPALGNHETMGGKMSDGLARFLKFYGLEREYYSFELGRWKFIVLSWMLSDEIMDGKGETCAEGQWLKKELAAAKGKEIVVACHMPLYTAGSKSKQEISNGPTWLTRMFSASGVRVVFSGHDHHYCRAKRDGVTYVISAGAGGDFVALSRKQEAQAEDVYFGVEKGKYLLHNPAFDPVEREVTPPNYVVEIELNEDQLTGRAVTIENVDLDRFELKRSAEAAKKTEPVRQPEPVGVGK